MNPGDAAFLSNTISSQADLYKGMADVSLGHTLAALLLVIALILLLAWIARKLGAAKHPAGEAQPKKILYCCRFNAEQTLIIVERDKSVVVMVLRGKKLELMAPVPGIAVGREPAGKPGRNFGEIYSRLMKRKDPE